MSISQDLKTLNLAGQVIEPGNDSYEVSRMVWNGIWDRKPAAIVKASNIEDVQRVVRLAAKREVLLAVRGGGHSIPGLSTCDGGIVLDLGQLNSVHIDPKSRTATVGGGALLGDLDRAGAPYGLVVPAGVISHTGAGGLTLGGGMGWLSRRFGLTIDHLLSAEVVTVTGEIILASADNAPDLFWGLKGGGGNFGVVTKFVYRMQETGGIEARNWTYPLTSVGKALAGIASAAAAAPRNLTVSLSVSRSGLSLTVLQSGPSIDPTAWELFASLDGSGVAGPVFTDFAAFQCRNDDFVAWGRRYYSRGGFLSDLGADAISAIVRIAEDFPTPDAEVYLIQLGGAVGDIPELAAAYSGRSAGWYWIVQPIWDSGADDASCLAFGRSGAARMAAVSMAGNYVNEQGDASVDIARESYGEVKYRRLADLKAKYDPANFFRLNQNIMPS